MGLLRICLIAVNFPMTFSHHITIVITLKAFILAISTDHRMLHTFSKVLHHLLLLPSGPSTTFLQMVHLSEFPIQPLPYHSN